MQSEIIESTKEILTTQNSMILGLKIKEAFISDTIIVQH